MLALNLCVDGVANAGVSTWRKPFQHGGRFEPYDGRRKRPDTHVNLVATESGQRSAFSFQPTLLTTGRANLVGQSFLWLRAES